MTIIKQKGGIPNAQQLDEKQFSAVWQTIERFIAKQEGQHKGIQSCLNGEIDKNNNNINTPGSNRHLKHTRQIHSHTSGGIQSSPSIFGHKKSTYKTTNESTSNCSSAQKKKIDYQELMETRLSILQSSPKKIEKTEEKAIEQPIETWKRMVLYSATQIKTRHIMCEEGCNEAAISMWMSSFGDRWDCCLSCQKKRFGGEYDNVKSRWNVVLARETDANSSSTWSSTANSKKQVSNKMQGKTQPFPIPMSSTNSNMVSNKRQRKTQPFPMPTDVQVKAEGHKKVPGVFPSPVTK